MFRKVVFALAMMIMVAPIVFGQDQVARKQVEKLNDALTVQAPKWNQGLKDIEALKNRQTSGGSTVTKITVRDSQAQQTANRGLAWSVRMNFVDQNGQFPDIEKIESLLSQIVIGSMSPKIFENAILEAAKKEGWTYLQEPIKGRDGRDGTPGKDGHDGKNGADGTPGRDDTPGADANPADVAEVLKNDPAFIAAVTGPPGEPGPPGADADNAVDEIKTEVNNLGLELSAKADKSEVARLSLVIADLNPDYASEKHLLWSPVTGEGMSYKLNMEKTVLRDWLSDRFRKKDGTFDKKGATKWLRSVLPDDLANEIASRL